MYILSSVPFFGDVLDGYIKSSYDSLLELKDSFETDVVINDFDKSWKIKDVSFDSNKNHYRKQVIHTAEFDFPLRSF
jgi:hypothetical protein